MYAEGNPRTKRELKERIEKGEKVKVFSPGPFPAPQDGVCTLEGPHYPEPHRWYANATVENGIIIKVI